MNLKKRLTITFITIIFLPVILTAVAFLWIGGIVSYKPDEQGGIIDGKYDISFEAISAITELTDETFYELQSQVSIDPERFMNREYLEEVNDKLRETSSFIIVRTEDAIYYTGDEEASQNLYDKLPGYGFGNGKEDGGYLYKRLRKLVKQIDFELPDGKQGSLFIVTQVNNVVSSHIVINLFVAIVAILIFTSVMLTRWINKGVFYPIRQLNKAMHSIADGNFEYALQAEENTGEIRELFQSYEDMRLKLKESTEEKLQNEKQNRELITNISHDLKTPITAIKGYVEGIMDGVADTQEKINKYIKTIYTKTNEMDRLINELTYYSGIDSNRIPYNFHRINVSEYFNDCVEDVGLDLESKNIQLNYSNLLPQDTRIIADPEQLKKVINNIVGNSIKYIDKEKGVIDIRLLDEVDSIRVEIEDNGKGIEAKDLGKIFERFYRTDASRNSSQGGSGIGLSIVKKIIEDHGGYIWATSKVGEGTCMHFVIRKYKEMGENENE
ncbi:MAG: HAMP domain-containing sensor histidine kinase [Lachnospiraceae bacterium]|nr:HAMP domain-containing sensor histidine kinase [Lachnospiraceae bacterium]